MILSDSILTQIKEQFISPLIEGGEFLLKKALKAIPTTVNKHSTFKVNSVYFIFKVDLV